MRQCRGAWLLDHRKARLRHSAVLARDIGKRSIRNARTPDAETEWSRRTSNAAGNECSRLAHFTCGRRGYNDALTISGEMDLSRRELSGKCVWFALTGVDPKHRPRTRVGDKKTTGKRELAGLSQPFMKDFRAGWRTNYGS